VLIIDDLLLGGFQFVLKRLADAVDSELNDDKVYREELLAAQMRLELGEITAEEFAEVEADLLAKIREVRERHGVAAPTMGSGRYAVGDVEVSADFGESEMKTETSEALETPRRRTARRRD